MQKKRADYVQLMVKFTSQFGLNFQFRNRAFEF